MLRIVLLGIFIVFWSNASAQDEYLLIQIDGSIDIVTVDPQNNTIPLFNSLDELKGYKIDGDTLIVFVSDQANGGSLKEHRILNPVSLYKFENPMESKINSQNKIEFSFGSFSMLEGNELVLYKDKNLLWTKDFKVRDVGGMQFGKYYYDDFNVLMKEEKLLCVKSKRHWLGEKKTVIEIDLNTGDEKIIAKKSFMASCSPLGKYVLSQECYSQGRKVKRFNLFNRDKNKVVEGFHFFEQAYWLYK